MNKMRVWWIPQIESNEERFYVPVNDEVEGKKILDLLGAYDAYQLQNNIKLDYDNIGGLQIWNDEIADYEDWHLETDDGYYYDVDEYLMDNEECNEFCEEIFKQIDWKRIEDWRNDSEL